MCLTDKLLVIVCLKGYTFIKVDNIGKTDSHYSFPHTVVFCGEITYRIVLAHTPHRILWPHQF